MLHAISFPVISAGTSLLYTELRSTLRPQVYSNPSTKLDYLVRDHVTLYSSTTITWLQIRPGGPLPNRVYANWQCFFV